MCIITKVVDVSVNKQTKNVKNVKITTNRVKMLVDIMTIVSYNSKYKAKTKKMQQKYQKILERIWNGYIATYTL